LRDIAVELSAPEDEVEAVLLRLQTLEPTGIFARNLSECLALQAKEADWLDGPMQIILQNLDLLAAGNTARLARLCHSDEAAVLLRFQRIRSLNPKPCSDFTPGTPVATREPDLLARPLKGGRWQITLNRSALPDLEVIEGDKTSRDPEALGAAKALRHMLTARNSTLLKVGREIATRQLAALIQGPAALQPMTMAEVAATLGLHESTISRVVAGASLDSPRGVWWLRQMFSGARGQGAQADSGSATMAAAALRHRLTRLIAEESPQAPLSDQALTERLAQETGVTLARRTVAKYREMQGIPAAHRRRKGPPARRSAAKPGETTSAG
jgi:RNA polymerase sigma-54 factor